MPINHTTGEDFFPRVSVALLLSSSQLEEHTSFSVSLSLLSCRYGLSRGLIITTLVDNETSFSNCGSCEHLNLSVKSTTRASVILCLYNTELTLWHRTFFAITFHSLMLASLHPVPCIQTCLTEVASYIMIQFIWHADICRNIFHVFLNQRIKKMMSWLQS